MIISEIRQVPIKLTVGRRMTQCYTVRSHVCSEHHPMVGHGVYVETIAGTHKVPHGEENEHKRYGDANQHGQKEKHC